MKKIFCCPVLPLLKTVLFVSSRAFSLSTPTFLFSTPVENSEATWKKAKKCNKAICQQHLLSTWCFVELLWIPLQNSIGLDLLWEIDLPMKSFGTSVKFEWNPLYTGRVYGQCSGHHPGWRPDEGHGATPHCGPNCKISSTI